MRDKVVQYRVEPVPPPVAEPDLLRIWADNLPLAGPAERKYGWLYREAPDVPRAVFLLNAVNECGEPRAVGSSAVLIRHFQVGGRMVRAGLLADLAVDKAHRTVLPALRLVRAARQFALQEHDLVYGLPNPLSTPLFQRVGYRRLGMMRRFVRLLRHGEYLHRLDEVPRMPARLGRALSASRLVRGLGPVVDVARMALDGGRLAESLARYTLGWQAGPDERFNSLWGAARGEYGVVGQRTASFLRWRFASDPRTRFAVLGPRGNRGIRAYAVVRMSATGGAKARILDFFGHLDALPALFDRLSLALWRRGETSVSLRWLGNPRIAEILTARGFRELPGKQPVFYELGPDLGVHGNVAGNLARWHVCDGDNDVD